jgi:hypothetical protein
MLLRFPLKGVSPSPAPVRTIVKQAADCQEPWRSRSMRACSPDDACSFIADVHTSADRARGPNEVRKIHREFAQPRPSEMGDHRRCKQLAGDKQVNQGRGPSRGTTNIARPVKTAPNNPPLYAHPTYRESSAVSVDGARVRSDVQPRHVAKRPLSSAIAKGRVRPPFVDIFPIPTIGRFGTDFSLRVDEFRRQAAFAQSPRTNPCPGSFHSQASMRIQPAIPQRCGRRRYPHHPFAVRIASYPGRFARSPQ